jgi:ABC-type microcin C transport system duplicated ATPase subunit YejF
MISFNQVNFSYSGKQSTLRDIDFELATGSNLGIVGESGSGKSTLMKLALGLHHPVSGEIRFDGQLVNFRNRDFARVYRKSVQAVFQDPYSSLDPRQKIQGVVAEPLNSLGLAQNKPRGWVLDRVRQTLIDVGLDESALQKYPHEFSGGQRQRIAIARAIVSGPKLLLADEPVSSLDVANRELVLELLKTLQAQYGLTIVVISHDLSVIAALCQEIIVLERGAIVEHGLVATVLASPSEPYTKKLLRAVPRLPTL